MSNELQIFSSAEFGTVRTLMINGEPWFCVADVARCLEYSENTRTTVIAACVPEEWKGVYPLNTPSGTQNMLCISEQGLYFLLGRSDKPKALPFQKWLAGEVLPSIRKHGMYATAPTIESILANPDMFITLLQQYKEEHTERVRLEAINHQQAIENEALLDENTRLNDRLGFGETWKQVPAIPYFNKYFDMRQNAVWRQLGVALTRLSNELGYDTMRVPDTRFPDGVKCYHVDVVDYFEQLLKDGEDTSQYIKDKWKRKNVPMEEN